MESVTDRVTYIYALCEPGYVPVEGEAPPAAVVRYVGKADNPLKRYNAHVKSSRATIGNFPVHKWIARRLSDGLRPVQVIIEVTGDGWAAREVYWIAYYRSIGAHLLNLTDGGEGASNLSPETLVKRALAISLALTGTKWTPERRARFSEVRRGVTQTPEAIAKRTAGINKTFADPERVKFRNAAIKRAYDEKPERREAKRAAFLATWAKDGAHEAASEERKRRWVDPEYKARVTASLIAAGSRPEVKEKVGKATREHWQDNEFRARETEKRRRQGADPDFRAKMRAINNTPEHRDASSSAMTDLWADPIWKANMLATRARHKAEREAAQ